MGLNRCFLIFGENNILVRRNDMQEHFSCGFRKIETYPNIPFYHCLWEDKKYIEDFSNYYRHHVLAKKALFKKMGRPTVFVALPDDAIFIDKRVILDFLMSSISKEVLFVPTYNLADLSIDTYVFISKTKRMFVFSYIKEGALEYQTRVELFNQSPEEIVNIKSALHYDCRFGNVPTYLFGEGMGQYERLGQVITPSEVLENLVKYVGDAKTDGRGEFVFSK